jgi:putative ABC transport system permease protein
MASFTDLRVAVRTLARAPGFALAVVVTLAMATGVSTGFFGVVNALLLRPLPGVDAHGLVSLHVTRDGKLEGFSGFSHPAYRELRQRARTLAALEAFAGRGFALQEGSGSALVGGQLVSGGFFALLGTHAARGRLLGPDDDSPGAPAVAVISHALWRRLGASDALVGSTLRLGGHPVTVVGVAELGFRGHFLGFPMDVFAPLAAAPVLARDLDLESRAAEDLELIGRLRPGLAHKAAADELGGIARELAHELPAEWRGRGVELQPFTGLDADLRRPVLGFVAVLLVVGALVLLVACVNVAGLVLARGAERCRELAVRAALGATPRALLRPLIHETLLLFAAGGAAGVALAWPAARALHAFIPQFPIPIQLDASPDWRVGLFAFAATLVAGMLFGLAPAASAARVDLVSVLGRGGRALARGSQAGRRAFVAAQVALSLVLLVAAFLFLRVLQHERALDPGFRIERAGFVTVDLRLLDRERSSDAAFFEAWLARVRSSQGVEAASVARFLPLGLAPATTRVNVNGLIAPAAEGFPSGFNVVSPGYFETLGIPLLAGRDFEKSDGPAAEPVAVISRATAARLFPARDPVGRALKHEGRSLRVVGVVGDIVTDRHAARGGLFLYVPWAQRPAPSASLVLRARGALPLEQARREARALEPDAPLVASGSLAQHAGGALFPQRLAAAVTLAFGLFGLLLASVGLYGIVAFFAVERRRELAVRAALGARSADLWRLVVLSGLRPVAAGIGLGLCGSVAFVIVARRLISGLGSFDALPFAAGSLLLALVATVAADLPARRAASRSTSEGLRAE